MMNKKIKKMMIKQTTEVLKQCEADKKRLLGHIEKINIDILTANLILKGLKDE